MNVADLKEALDDFGNHLEVVVRYTNENTGKETEFKIVQLDGGIVDDVTGVVIEVEK